MLRGILGAKSSKEMALEFGISYRTIETYRTRLSEKIGARGQLDLFRIVVAVERES